MSDPLTGKELELFRINFVEKLKEPMRSDFRRVVDTIADLERQLAEVQALLPRLKRYLYPEAYGGKVLATDRLELAEAVDRIMSKEGNE